MVTKEECEENGMIFVKSHKNSKGRWIKAYCRRMTIKEIKKRNRDEEEKIHWLAPKYY